MQEKYTFFPQIIEKNSNQLFQVRLEYYSIKTCWLDCSTGIMLILEGKCNQNSVFYKYSKYNFLACLFRPTPMVLWSSMQILSILFLSETYCPLESLCWIVHSHVLLPHLAKIAALSCLAYLFWSTLDDWAAVETCKLTTTEMMLCWYVSGGIKAAYTYKHARK